MSNKVVELYKEAWESHNIEILTTIFHDDIRYQERCNNVIVGIDSLIEYWIVNSKKQSEVKFLPLKVVKSNNEIVVFWEAEFYESIKCKIVHLQGIMWLSIRENKIYELIEFFEYK